MAKRKPTKYNLILKQFTKLNNKLPEENKLSIQQRRAIIKQFVLPSYKDVPIYKIRLKSLKSLLQKEADKVPPKEICDLNFIDVSEYALVEWYSLDETIRELIPNCVYVKVSAGEFGETNVFNTRNYEYGRRGVRQIVEAIRPEADNLSGKFIFSGYQKLRKGKKNNGTPDNYYLDLVLIIIDKDGGQEPQGDIDVVRFPIAKTRENQKKKTKIKNIIEGKIKLLKTKKDSIKRAKKTLEKNIKKFEEANKKTAKKPTKNSSTIAMRQFNATAALLEKYYKEGKITKEQYDKALAKIFKEFER